MIKQIEPYFDDREEYHIKKVLESTFFVEAEYTKKLEQFICDYTGASCATAMSNATVALYCCLKALGIDKKEYEVIVPDMTFIATANAVIMAGATPVFCDVCVDDCGMDPGLLERLITPNTKAIIPVHLYGMSCGIHDVVDSANRHGIKVIEDCAQSLGVFLKNDSIHTGMFGDCGVFSFYGNKVISSGEGAVIITNDEELNNKLYRLKNHGRDKKGVFIHDEIGFNFCYTDLQAAIAIAQLEKLEDIIERKKEIYDYYVEGLKDVECLNFLGFENREYSNYWFSSFLFKRKNGLKKFLLDSDIQTRDFFYPLHLQPCYQNNNIGLGSYRFFNKSEFLYEHGLSLPSSYLLTFEEQDYIISKIKEFYGNSRLFFGVGK